MGDHESPCSVLQTHIQDNKEIQRAVAMHERELGGIAADLKTVIAGQTKLFTRTDELCGIAIENKANIENISQDLAEQKDQISNGLKAEIAKVVVEHARESFSGALAPLEKFEKRIQDLESVSWFPKLMDLSLKKVVGYALVALIIFTMANALTWGAFKWFGFGEKPGLMRGLSEDHNAIIDPKIHSHKDAQGRTVIHSHDNPDGDAIGRTNGVSK